MMVKRTLFLLLFFTGMAIGNAQNTFTNAEQYHDFIIEQKIIMQEATDDIGNFEVADSAIIWDAYYQALATTKSCLKVVKNAGQFEDNEKLYSTILQLFSNREQLLLNSYPQLISFYLIKDPIDLDFEAGEDITSSINQSEMIMEKLFLQAQSDFAAKYHFTPKDPYAEE
ncbi:MAG TPA: hypothetical protein PLJ00_03040 [Chitinophagales bacterium]|nr:hypothetical protein [Chitinophagales bacterium]HRG85502.1 hypothetical protein [Chitinophagales bacterium]HRH54636.1 hypothetical protein [Chitinophagales bacterium]